ncbi:MAG: 2,3-epoxybenzoyl-CoA dihydrolase, partial [Planctomycetota bacterium]
QYQHWKIDYQGPIAVLTMMVQEFKPLREGYQLKLNSYDLGVDVELADILERLRFSHPEVKVVIITGDLKQRVFCAGANIYMLGASSHPFKVNFCKFTNETRCGIEDTSKNSGARFIAALNGTASGGGYELALACDEIYLIDDGNSAVSFPEVPLLGVLPGTGGLTRLVDKRKIRRDLADVFSTKAEGIKGKKAVQWKLVDGCFSKSSFQEKVMARASDLVQKCDSPYRLQTPGIELTPLRVQVQDKKRLYETLSLTLEPEKRVATLEVRAPENLPPSSPEEALKQGADFWPLKFFRELRDAIYHLRFNYPDIGVVVLRSKGDGKKVLAYDQLLNNHPKNWFLHEVVLLGGRVFRMLDINSKSQFTLIDQGTCFYGTLYEMALTSDRIYMLEGESDQNIRIALSVANTGLYPMANGWTRLKSRFHGTPELEKKSVDRLPQELDSIEALEYGLVTFTPDSIDWDDEVRLAIEERSSLSPDALTGMESSLRFAGPETLETKIYGRLSAWQNWIFTRPNSTGEYGAITCYGQPKRPQFDWRRT